MQEISLNPQKLAGQCSKLKCCLMYEYDVYADARRTIPRLREPLQTLDGEWFLVKIDPLAGTMSFSTSKGTMANLTTLPISRVREIIALNRAGEKAETLIGEGDETRVEEPTYRSEEDSITRFDNKSKRNKRNKRRGNKGEGHETAPAETAPVEAAPEAKDTTETKGNDEPQQGEQRRERKDRRDRRDRRERRNNGEGGENRENRENRESAPEAAAQQNGEATNNENAERPERGERNDRRRHHHRGRRNGGERRERNAENNNKNNE